MKFIKITGKTIVLTILLFYWTISRHEGSHALVAWMEGAEINEVKLWPGVHEELGFYFAYVDHSGETSWLTEAAPFFSDILLLIIASALLFRNPGTRHYYAILLLGFVSPLIDLLYNYQGGFWRSGTDVSDLLELLPGPIVHTAFGLTLFSAITLLVIFTKRRKKLLHA